MTAKSLGGGMPMAAVTGKAEIMDNTGPGHRVERSAAIL